MDSAELLLRKDEALPLPDQISGILRERRSESYAVNAWNALTRIGEHAPELRAGIGKVLESSMLEDAPPLFIRCFGSDRPLGILNRMRKWRWRWSGTASAIPASTGRSGRWSFRRFGTRSAV